MSSPFLCARRVLCIHAGGPPCVRCKERGDECIFPPKGTSFIFRRSRFERQTQTQTQPQPQSQPQTQAQAQAQAQNLSNVSSVSDTTAPSSVLSGSTVASSSTAVDDGIERPKVNLSDVDPLDYMTDEVKQSYLRCSYKWSFHHIPTLFTEIRNRSLDKSVAWAMLALIIRFSQKAPDGFATQIETSNAFAAHTRALILPSIDDPTLQRIQVLLMLTGHSWGAGEGKRAWVYLGMAVRMCQIMGLFEECSNSSATMSKEEFIHNEERRRTAWTCFLMDSLLSGGKGRGRSLSADHMNIQLPCDTGNFNFGEPVCCARIDGSLPTGRPTLPTGKLGIVAYSMRAADIWGAVAKWACSSHSNHTPPWQAESEFQRLLARLDKWRDSLPPRLRFGLPLLRAHSAANQGQAYCYMHCIYFMSVIFLYRSYLPELEMQEADHENAEWKEWTARSCGELANVADRLCEVLHEIRGFGPFFLRGLVPWVGFTVYTAVGTLLYFFHFPHVEEGDPQIERWQQRIIDGCIFLKDMRQAWPMADTWRETIKAMHIFYSNIKSKGTQAVSPKERREMRNAIVDYGALQPSPVQVHDSGTEEEDAEAVSEAEDANDAQMETQDFGPVPLPPADIDLFDTHFDIDAAMRASFADATHGFWEGFPGNMEITEW
ncbi:putative transcriptional regulatory PB1A11.04c-like protein [Cladobotryum mycophilum]|uniref:Transcriptional regulatory PB1A11.04c-like protein n=1 Tax=Cladobotryum mycophilum TaxID=491253 RepID=A0ABR0SBI1_9HYPO